MEIIETMLPGVGMRYDLQTAAGRPICVVVRRDGKVDFGTYDLRDPDQLAETYRLEAEEVAALADILGAPRMSERFADLSREVPGLESGRLTIGRGSRYDGRTLGDTHARTRTGASVVAIVRGEDVVTSPTPEDGLRAGDVVVAIGSAESLRALDALLNRLPD
ncbi:cation:proton antiporter regulatory subunit [Actinomycetota bacterium]